jgi:hypothetical protein
VVWGGLRGALALALALSLSSAFPYREQILNLTFGVVIFSLLVQGLTIKPLLKTPRTCEWLQRNLLYTAVVFEVDKTKLPERIAQAEKALALRARELFYAARDSSAEEEQALDDAVYALHALRTTSQTNHCMPPVVAVV